MSKMRVHRTFGVSRSTIDEWLELRERTGNVLPVRYRRGALPRLNDAAALRTFVAAAPDRTLQEMADLWHLETGVRVSAVTFAKSLRRIGYTRKKKAFSSSSDEKTNAKSGSNSSQK